MRASSQACWAVLAALVLLNTVVAQPLLVKRILEIQNRRNVLSRHPRDAKQRRVALDEVPFGGSHDPGVPRDKRVVKTLVVSLGSGLKAATLAGLQALGRASAGTVGLVGKASSGAISTLGAASLGAAGAASSAGTKALGAASSLGLAGAKGVTKVSLAGAKTVGVAGAKIAVKTGFKVAKAAVTVGIARFILSLVFGKINQLLDFKNKLAGGLGISNFKPSNSIFGVSSSSSSSGDQSETQEEEGQPGDPSKDEELPEINPESVSLQLPDAFFSKGFNVVNKASPVIGEVVQNTAERAAMLIQNAKPLLKSSVFRSSQSNDPTWNVEVEDDAPNPER